MCLTFITNNQGKQTPTLRATHPVFFSPQSCTGNMRAEASAFDRQHSVPIEYQALGGKAR